MLTFNIINMLTYNIFLLTCDLFMLKYYKIMLTCDIVKLYVNIIVLHVDMIKLHCNKIITYVDIIDLACMGRSMLPCRSDPKDPPIQSPLTTSSGY